MNLQIMKSPLSDDEWLCWCGAIHCSEAQALTCVHNRPRLPVVPQRPAVRPAAAPAEQKEWKSPKGEAVGAFVCVVWVVMLMLVLMVANQGDPGPAAGMPDDGPGAGAAAGVMP